METKTHRPRIGIIGGGHLGRIHAKLAKANPNCEVVAVADPFAPSRELVESQLSIPTLADYRELEGSIDGAIIATPTFLHHKTGVWCLNHGIHTLIEKPIASSLREAAELVQLAKRNQRTLQVGHVERFNPAWQYAVSQIDLESVRYLEAAREGTYTGRSTDIGIVMDLMIHDLDLILQTVNSPVDHVHAYGWSVLGKHEDFAVAGVHFKNGVVGHFRASRISPIAKRTMQVHTDTGVLDIDFATSSVTKTEPVQDVLDGVRQADSLPAAERAKVKDSLFTNWLGRQQTQVEPKNAIELEQNEFFNAIRDVTPVTVTGEHGYQALELAERILDQIAINRPARGIIPAADLFGKSKAA